MSQAVAVYCASSLGEKETYRRAAISVGQALAQAGRPLVYGGGSQGLMGLVSSAALDGGGKVTGIMPRAMVTWGGENDKTDPSMPVVLDPERQEKMELVVVDSMHARKVEMARRSVGFIGLPGGFGTYEEVMEVTTWTQLGIHTKPVVLVNALSFWEPLRQLIRNGIEAGFIPPSNEQLIVFVDGPSEHSKHIDFDWGAAAIEAIEGWKSDTVFTYRYKWSTNEQESSLDLGST